MGLLFFFFVSSCYNGVPECFVQFKSLEDIQRAHDWRFGGLCGMSMVSADSLLCEGGPFGIVAMVLVGLEGSGWERGRGILMVCRMPAFLPG